MYHVTSVCFVVLVSDVLSLLTFPQGQYEYLAISFSFANPPVILQVFVNNLLGFVYLDDVLIFSKLCEEHVFHIQSVRQHLLKNSLSSKQKRGRIQIDPARVFACRRRGLPKPKVQVHLCSRPSSALSRVSNLNFTRRVTVQRKACVKSPFPLQDCCSVGCSPHMFLLSHIGRGHQILCQGLNTSLLTKLIQVFSYSRSLTAAAIS